MTKCNVSVESKPELLATLAMGAVGSIYGIVRYRDMFEHNPFVSAEFRPTLQRIFRLFACIFLAILCLFMFLVLSD